MTFQQVRPHGEPKPGHDRGGADTSSGDVAYHETEVAVVESDDAVPVTADVHPLGAGHVPGGNLQVADRRVPCREQGLLQPLGDGALLTVERVELAVKTGDQLGVGLGDLPAACQPVAHRGGADRDATPCEQEDPGQIPAQGPAQRLLG